LIGKTIVLKGEKQISKRKENAKITYGAHPGRRRAYLPGRFEFLDAEGRVGCGIDGSTSLCRKMGKEVRGSRKKN
jgi:hypothetical protein